MATKNIREVMYNGSIRLTYLDASHRYYIQTRTNWDLPETDAKAWSSKKMSGGVTGLIDGTLEKKGLMDWSLNMAMKDLFGLYDFEIDNRKIKGFKKDPDTKELIGRLWGKNGTLKALTEEEALPVIIAGKNASTDYKTKAADIGTTVHEAIEKFVNGEAVNIGEAYRAIVESRLPEMTDIAAKETLETIEQDIEMAEKAFAAFTNWIHTSGFTILHQEKPVYSIEYGYCGLFDAIAKANGKIVMLDWKTSKASVPAGAPDGVYYTYLLQDALYALALEEMGYKRLDDLGVVSVRKDGGFSIVFASDLGYSVEQMIGYARNVIECNRHMKQLKKQLIEFHKNSSKG